MFRIMNTDQFELDLRVVQPCASATTAGLNQQMSQTYYWSLCECA